MFLFYFVISGFLKNNSFGHFLFVISKMSENLEFTILFIRIVSLNFIVFCSD